VNFLASSVETLDFVALHNFLTGRQREDGAGLHQGKMYCGGGNRDRSRNLNLMAAYPR